MPFPYLLVVVLPIRRTKGGRNRRAVPPPRRSATQTLVPAQLLGIAKQLKRSRACLERLAVARDLRELVSRARGRRDGPDKVEDRERRIELYAVARGDAERAARGRLQDPVTETTREGDDVARELLIDRVREIGQ